MSVKIITGDCLETLRGLPPCFRVNCCVTSPPYYGLRDYGHDGQIGLEATPDEYVARLVEVFRAVRDHLEDDGTLWLNLGDSYAAARGGTTPPAETLAGGVGGKGDDESSRGRKSGYNPSRDAPSIGLKHKDLMGTPWRVAFALQADGWYLRSDIIWHKPNPMPESVTDRPTKSHEYLFLLAKSPAYYYDAKAIAEPPQGLGKTAIRFGGEKYGDSNDPKHATKSGNEYTDTGSRNRRSVWTVPTSPYSGAHFATFPPALIEPCILAGCKEGGTVLDPFGGAGTTGLVADRLGRNALLLELNPEYAEMARERIRGDAPMFAEVV